VRLEIPILAGNIVLRTLQPRDVTPAYLAWLTDPAINAYLEVRFSQPLTLNELGAFVDDTNRSLHTLMAGIFLRENDRHIGNIKLGPIDWNHQVGEIGFLLGDKEQWGRGYASKAISMLTDYAFNELGLAKVTAGCYVENEGSRLALLKAGFVEEGRLILQWLVANSRQDGVLMGRVNPGLLHHRSRN